jgi:hypothetical protein
MTNFPRELLHPIAASPDSPEGAARLESDTELLLLLTGRLGPRDLAALAHIVRRAAEICETEGVETAVAVLDQIEAILQDRAADA